MKKKKSDEKNKKQEKKSEKKSKARKKSVKKKISSKTKKENSQEKISGNRNEKVLVENFVALQGVMTNVASKLDELTNQVSGLLNIFEESAKTLAQKDFDMPGNDEVLKKIDKLFEQNKIIAKGLTMLHEGKPSQLQAPPAPQNFSSATGAVPISQTNSQSAIPVPQNPAAAPQAGEQYQKSISSTPQKFNPLPKR